MSTGLFWLLGRRTAAGMRRMGSPWLLPMATLAAAISGWGCIQSTAVDCGKDGQRCCEQSSCFSGGECGTDDFCHACGAPDQACCEGSSCAAGAECRADALCHACGSLGQACCNGAACSAGLRCDNSACVAPCGAACVPGATRCSAAGGIELCTYQQPPCTAWTTVFAQCPAGQTCQDGVCKVTCENECTPEALLCTSDGLKSCDVDPQTQCPTLHLVPELPDNPSCLTGACDGGWCWENPLPQGNPLVDILGGAADRLLLLDGMGNVVAHDGANWSYFHRNERALSRMRRLGSCFGSYFLAVGERGIVDRYVGGNWQSWNVPDWTNLNGVACASPGIEQPLVVAVGDRGQAFARRWDSAAWNRLSTSVTTTLSSVTLVDYGQGQGLHALIVGADGLVLQCSDLDGVGVCVQEAIDINTGAPATSADLEAVWASYDGRVVVAVGDHGAILERSEHWNFDWAVIPNLLVDRLRGVDGRAEDGTVFVVGENGAFARRSPLADWESSTFNAEVLRDVLSMDSSHLYVVSETGTVWLNQVDGMASPLFETWKPVDARSPTRLALNALCGTSSKDVFAAGEAGVILHKRGDVWVREAQGLTSSDLLACTSASAEETYAVGARGTIARRHQGSWTLEGAGLTSNDLRAAFSAGGTVFVVGDGGVWLQKRAGAQDDWALLTPTTESLWALTGSADGSEVWAAGSDCTLVGLREGAFSTGLVKGCDPGTWLMAAWQSPGGDLYLAADSYIILHRRAGVWTKESLFFGEVASRAALTGHGEDVWTSLSESASVFHRTAGQWTPEADGLMSPIINALWASPEGQLYVAGNDGMILHRR
ncbi:MAG: hypothetical protein HY901_18950 [Deltaproteobacteria bacterium]|nr:hypothetical protein [Deltaproteobacteria bacterium]